MTGITAVTAVLFSWDVDHRPNEFFFWLLLVVGGSYGVFLSADLFLFFVFYELVIVPKYFLIAIWGSTNKEYGAMKLTLYSFFGGALVFIGILALTSRAGSLDLQQLARFPFRASPATLGVPGFVSRVRHSRRHLAVAYVGADRPRRRADRRFDVARRHCHETRRLRRAARRHEYFSEGFRDVAEWIAVLAVIGIVYAAAVALRQRDLKFVIGYSSVSHMGFVLLGLAAATALGVSGAVLQMFSHGIIGALLFAIAGR